MIGSDDRFAQLTIGGKMNLRKMWLWLGSIAPFAAPANFSYAAVPDAEAQHAAQVMVDRFADAWDHADGTAYALNYWPEAGLVDPSGTIVSGQPAIVQEHIQMWAGAFMP